VVRTRHVSHHFSLLMFLVIILFNAINDSSVVHDFSGCLVYLWSTFRIVLLWIISTIKTVKDKFVPLVCLASPAITFLISENSKTLLCYVFDNELILINGLITFLGLLLISKSHNCNSILSTSSSMKLLVIKNSIGNCNLGYF
jgi:hypothetical protein